MRAHVSCNCRHCQATPSKVKADHKRKAHRALRRASKDALRKDGEPPVTVSTGYKA